MARQDGVDYPIETTSGDEREVPRQIVLQVLAIVVEVAMSIIVDAYINGQGTKMVSSIDFE